MQACQPWCMVEISLADAHAHCSLDRQCAGRATLTKCLLQPPKPLRSNLVKDPYIATKYLKWHAPLTSQQNDC